MRPSFDCTVELGCVDDQGDGRPRRTAPTRACAMERGDVEATDRRKRRLTRNAVEKVEGARREGRRLLADGKVSQLLDAALEGKENDPSVFFDLLETLLDVSQAEDAVDVFQYLERVADDVQQPAMVAHGKFHVLRACTQLLRRMSRREHAHACGLAQFFLAQFLPMHDRSGTNPAGPPEVEFPVHIDKMNDKPSGKEAAALPPVSYSFYSAFWSVQESFQKPQKLVEASTWKNFERIVRKALVNFASSANTEERESTFRETDAWPYLTTWRITGLQLKQPTFRACFLLQALVFTEYALHPPSPQVQPLSDEMKSGANNLKEEISKALSATISVPGFAELLDNTFVQEMGWVEWKRAKCPSRSRPVANSLGESETAPPGKRMRVGLTELLPGPEAFKGLEDISMGKLDGLQDRALVVPLAEFFKVAAEQEDPDNAIEEPYKMVHDNLFRWRAFRRVSAEEFDKLQDLVTDTAALKRYACSKSKATS